ncbi:MAG: hypothetical protein K6F85_05465 [Bacteroidales bacterium]|nr:hypothetical protein [Bacteroidales bacterium]
MAMTPEQIKIYEQKMTGLYNRMIHATNPIIRQADGPAEALELLRQYAQNIALSIIVQFGGPVKENYDIWLKSLGNIPNLDKLEAQAETEKIKMQKFFSEMKQNEEYINIQTIKGKA